jgi:hypothetical protein
MEEKRYLEDQKKEVEKREMIQTDHLKEIIKDLNQHEA